MISRILNDFYHITHITSQFLDENLKSVEIKGSFFGLPEVYFEKLSLNATTVIKKDECNYIILPFNETSHQRGYFIIGPFQSINEENNPIPYKPDHLTPYLEDLFISIVKKNIANATESNPHIAKGIKYIHENYHEAINLHTVCEFLNLNTCYFCVLFKNQTNMTFSKYLNKLRINESKKLLATTADSIIDISLAVGFNNHNHFSATFKKLTGVTPSVYRNELK